MAAQYRIGIDIGGTFADFSLMDETGKVRIAKVPSTPANPEESVINGIRQFQEQYGIDPSEIVYFVHGTTIGVNTVIQRNGARTGLLVTKGFRDILNLGRSRLPDIYDLLAEKPAPLVRRRHVREIDERMLANGEMLRGVAAEEVRAAAQALVADGVEAITVSFLHSYRNDANERAAKQIIEEACPGVFVSLSSEIWPQIREYERTLISVINAFVGKKMSRYFVSLEKKVAATGMKSTILSTKSNGGIMTATSARERPVETLCSGPASGVIGAHFVARASGFDRVIGLDMGGTSTEVAVIEKDVRYSTENKVGEFEISTPAVDVSSIGAGGGSIAWTDPAGVLKVGPDSAGADPGPACYDRGGDRPTITDAYVTMGIIDPKNFLGGKLELKPELAHRAIDQLARTLNLDRIATAEAIIRVATSNMYSELVPLMARKGVDVSEFALLPYGGAGPTHGLLLAKEVGIPRAIIPHSPGTLCALGALVADVKSDFITTIHRVLDKTDSGGVLDQIRAATADLERRALGWLDEERVNVVDRYVLRSADMRYLGQSFEVTVDLTGVDFVAADAAADIRKKFDTAYSAIYGHVDKTSSLEVINLRATAVGITSKPQLARLADAPLVGDAKEAKPAGFRPIFAEGRAMDAAIHKRSALTWGHEFSGPAIVEQYDSTVFIPDGFRCRVDAYGTIIGELAL
ncbi:MAG: hydantoinase/oxoprolinase family protein [Rhodospirillaceae bacterium]|nr:hydantoinase/oxoprolinase family protein [Rhodospirillaceae bacterium]